MITTNRYEISTIKDLAIKIPPEKIKRCLHEMETMIVTMQGMIISAELVGGDEIKQEVILSLPNEFVWVDDGENYSMSHISVNGQLLGDIVIHGEDCE